MYASHHRNSMTLWETSAQRTLSCKGFEWKNLFKSKFSHCMQRICLKVCCHIVCICTECCMRGSVWKFLIAALSEKFFLSSRSVSIYASLICSERLSKNAHRMVRNCWWKRLFVVWNGCGVNWKWIRGRVWSHSPKRYCEEMDCSLWLVSVIVSPRVKVFISFSLCQSMTLCQFIFQFFLFFSSLWSHLFSCRFCCLFCLAISE